MRDPRCNGRIGATGMCLGGHLAFRCAMDARVRAAVCYFATDIHSGTLGMGGDDSLRRVGEIKGELIMVSVQPLPLCSDLSHQTFLSPFLPRRRKSMIT